MSEAPPVGIHFTDSSLIKKVSRVTEIPERDRPTCWQCYRVKSLCWCNHILPFDLSVQIVLLIHPKEFQRTVGTARVVKQSIKESLAWTGYGPEFDRHPELLKMLADPVYLPFVLYPGSASLNLNQLSPAHLKENFPAGRKPVIFVIDGTWAHAKRMIRLSQVLSALPKISFESTRLSQYQFRKQPKPHCLSTVEAVCELVEILKEKKLCEVSPAGAHFHMLQVFQGLVQDQLRAQIELRKPRYVP